MPRDGQPDAAERRREPQADVEDDGYGEARAAYLGKVLASGDLLMTIDAVITLVRGFGIERVAARTGLPLSQLRRMLACDGMPDAETLLLAVKALGIELTARPNRTPAASSPLASDV